MSAMPTTLTACARVLGSRTHVVLTLPVPLGVPGESSSVEKVEHVAERADGVPLRSVGDPPPLMHDQATEHGNAMRRPSAGIDLRGDLRVPLLPQG